MRSQTSRWRRSRPDIRDVGGEAKSGVEEETELKLGEETKPKMGQEAESDVGEKAESDAGEEAESYMREEVATDIHGASVGMTAWRGVDAVSHAQASSCLEP